ncbi:MAG TPA: D-alanyl-D-alanine carboxypeptidase [Firmicutes bacterium]|nr:D-alanyl-D-alanine carboxypeptidase [Bacillota bacterium]
MQKKFLCAAAAAVGLLWGSLGFSYGEMTVAVMAGDLEVNAEAAVVMDADSGRLLYAQNPDKRLANASTTKIMTALLTLEQPDQDRYFTVDSDAIQVEGTTMGLQPGDSVTLHQLAAGMLLPSGNDAANAAAVEIAGSEEAFVRLMNQRAAELELQNTQYRNPSGLDAEGHYSSARDLATLAAHALENEDFADIVSKQEIRMAFGNPPYNRSLYTTNKLLERYPYAIGVKTGYTDDAGLCLVTAAEKDGTRLIIVTLNGKDDVNTHMRLYEHFFPLLARVDLSGFTEGLSVPVTGGTRDSVAAVPAAEPEAALLEREYDELTREVELPQFVYAPVEAGQVLGEIRLLSGDKVVWQSALVADSDVPALTRERQGILEFIGSLLGQ